MNQPCIKIYDKNDQGLSHAVFFSANGPRVLCSGQSITQVRKLLPAEKAKFKLRGVLTETLLGEGYAGGAADAHIPTLVHSNAPEFEVTERFSMAKEIIDVLLTGNGASAVLCGRGGTGKTHLVMDRVKDNGFMGTDMPTTLLSHTPDDEEDAEEAAYVNSILHPESSVPAGSKMYRHIKGALSATELFKLLYHHQNDVLIFDDCDSVLDDEVRINLLKAVLDTYDKRIVTWLSPYLEKQGYPASFEFKGTIIFVSNRPLSKIPQALQSRSLILNLDMTNSELCDHVRSIAHAMLPALTTMQRIELIDFIQSHADTFKDLSIRTFIKGATLMAKPNWKKLIRFAL